MVLEDLSPDANQLDAELGKFPGRIGEVYMRPQDVDKCALAHDFLGAFSEFGEVVLMYVDVRRTRTRTCTRMLDHGQSCYGFIFVTVQGDTSYPAS